MYEAAGEAISRAREGSGPTLLECKTNRFYGHFEGDAMTYKAPGEVKRQREECDCLKIFSAKVTASGLVTAAELEAIDKEVAAFDRRGGREGHGGTEADRGGSSD